MAAAEDVIVLDRGDNTTASVHLYGATLMSWKVKGEEYIFVSSKSLFDNKKAIRGGIPLVFPCFGPWDLGPQHGFARINRWAVEKGPHKGADGNVSAAFTLVDSEQTRGMWNHKFKLTYTVTLRESDIHTSFKVDNLGSDSFSFTCLLHTYFKVPDISKVTVSGLSGLTYVDKVKGGETATESLDLVVVAENVDRVYAKTGNTHVISPVAGGRSVTVTKENLPDTVVWNPWKEKAASMSDFGDEDYLEMVCVEAGHVSTERKLDAGQSFQASQTLLVSGSAQL